jgi:hypothetical protein
MRPSTFTTNNGERSMPDLTTPITVYGDVERLLAAEADDLPVRRLHAAEVVNASVCNCRHAYKD